MHQIVNIATSRGFGHTTDNGVMYLQRRGISQKREYGNAKYNFGVEQFADGSWEFSNNPNFAGQRISKEEGVAAVESLIQKHCGESLKFGKETIAYCYAGLGYAPVEKDDVFFSPVFYCEYSDSVRHAPSNVCLVAFEDGKFDQPKFDVDRAASEYLVHVHRALQCGFHSCDTKYGDDYCKRRLAWLSGCFLLESKPQPFLKSFVLGRDMSSKARIVL